MTIWPIEIELTFSKNFGNKIIKQMSSPALFKLPKVTTLLPPRMVPLLKTSWERIFEKPKPEASSSI